MRKAVNAALHTKYESGKWKKWFVETAKRVSKEVDENSNVRACSCVCTILPFALFINGVYYISRAFTLCFVHLQSFDMSMDGSVDDTPKKLKSTKKKNGKLTKILSTDFDGDSNVRACSYFMTCTDFAVPAFTCAAYFDFIFYLCTFAEFRR